MTYATLDDMTERFGERELIDATDRERTGSIVEARVTTALATADNQINASLLTRYTMPLASVPPILLDLACDIARYLIYPLDPPPLVRERYTDAQKVLAQLASGAKSLETEGAAPAAPAVAGVAYVTSERLMTRDKTRGFG